MSGTKKRFRAGDRRKIDGLEFEVGSGNVFEDLGLPNAELRMAKARLAGQVNAVIRARGLTQTEAAKLLGTKQPAISRLSQGKLSSITQDKLIQWLVALKQDVTISVKPARRKAHVSVEFAGVG